MAYIDKKTMSENVYLDDACLFTVGTETYDTTADALWYRMATNRENKLFAAAWSNHDKVPREEPPPMKRNRTDIERTDAKATRIRGGKKVKAMQLRQVKAELLSDK